VPKHQLITEKKQTNPSADFRKYLETSGLSMIDDNNVSDRKLIQGIEDDSKANENLSFKFAHMGALNSAQPVVNLKDLC